LDLLVTVDRSTRLVDLRRQLDDQLTQQLDILEKNFNVRRMIFIFHKSVANSTIKVIISITKRMISIIKHQHGHRQPLYARQQTTSSLSRGSLD